VVAQWLTRLPQIVVEKLTKNVNESHLHEIFGQFGRIKDLDLPMKCTVAPISPSPAGELAADTLAFQMARIAERPSFSTTT
jgi:RNA recognition motif-containing protein